MNDGPTYVIHGSHVEDCVTLWHSAELDTSLYHSACKVVRVPGTCLAVPGYQSRSVDTDRQTTGASDGHELFGDPFALSIAAGDVGDVCDARVDVVPFSDHMHITIAGWRDNVDSRNKMHRLHPRLA